MCLQASENYKSLVLQDKCIIEIFLSPDKKSIYTKICLIRDFGLLKMSDKKIAMLHFLLHLIPVVFMQ